jgi:hypothetical protein
MTRTAQSEALGSAGINQRGVVNEGVVQGRTGVLSQKLVKEFSKFVDGRNNVAHGARVGVITSVHVSFRGVHHSHWRTTRNLALL